MNIQIADVESRGVSKTFHWIMLFLWLLNMVLASFVLFVDQVSDWGRFRQSSQRMLARLYLSHIVGTGSVEPFDCVATLWYTHDESLDSTESTNETRKTRSGVVEEVGWTEQSDEHRRELRLGIVLAPSLLLRCVDPPLLQPGRYPKFPAEAQRNELRYLFLIKTISWNDCLDNAESDQLHSSLALAPFPRRLFVFGPGAEGSRKP